MPQFDPETDNPIYDAVVASLTPAVGTAEPTAEEAVALLRECVKAYYGESTDDAPFSAAEEFLAKHPKEEAP